MKPAMSSEALVMLLQLFEDAGIEVWLDGGWAVDAVLGEQTRLHKDATRKDDATYGISRRR